MELLCYSRPLSATRHSNRPLPQQPKEAPPRQAGGQAGAGDYASLTRYRDKHTGKKNLDNFDVYQEEKVAED